MCDRVDEGEIVGQAKPNVILVKLSTDRRLKLRPFATQSSGRLRRAELGAGCPILWDTAIVPIEKQRELHAELGALCFGASPVFGSRSQTMGRLRSDAWLCTPSSGRRGA